MISIITAAKGRVEQTIESFNSIWNNASNPEDIEHLIAVDCQDHELKKKLQEYKAFYSSAGINIVLSEVCHCQNPDGYTHRNLHREYWNPLAKQSKGDLVFGMPNDCVIQTNNFDKILLDALEEAKQSYKHDCFQILIDDDAENDTDRPEAIEKLTETSNWSIGSLEMNKKKAVENSKDGEVFCSWVILSRRAVDLIGGICPDEFQNEAADRHIYSVFSNTPIKSQLDLTEDIKTLHMSHYTGRAELDDVTRSKPVPTQPILQERLTVEETHPYHSRVNYEIVRQVFDLDKEIASL
tara:strand:+ start:293 stop:1180 length:888 start_codon:yes stop_codon:yes gene_type:complete